MLPPAMFSRRSFLSQAFWLAAAGGAFWLVRDKILWSAPQPRFAQGGGSSGWLSFAVPRQPMPTIKATVQGREVNALLDSGAQYSVVDRAFAEEMQLATSFTPLIAVGVGGQPQLGRGATVDVQVGDLSLARLKAGVLELGPIASPSGLSAPLILGQDVLRQVVADIDFPRRRLMLAADAEHELPQGVLAAPVQARGRALAAKVFVNGAPMEVTVDTGASMVLALASDVAQAAGLMTGQKPRYGASAVLGGQLAGQIVTAQAVAFAGAVFSDVDVLIFPSQRLPGFPKGLLGVGAMEGFRTILNHAAGEMHLLKPTPASTRRRSRR